MTPETLHIYSLKTPWTRLLHRLHTLGMTQQRYRTPLGEIYSEGIYPKQIVSASENKSTSIDHTQIWQTDQWKDAVAIVNPLRKSASIQFRSQLDQVFHQIELSQNAHWDCLECLLKTFSSDRAEAIALPHTLSKKKSMLTEAETKLQDVAKAINRQIIRGKELLFSIQSPEGNISYSHKAQSLMTKHGSLAQLSSSQRIQLYASNIDEIETMQSRKEFVTILRHFSTSSELVISAA